MTEDVAKEMLKRLQGLVREMNHVAAELDKAGWQVHLKGRCHQGASFPLHSPAISYNRYLE